MTDQTKAPELLHARPNGEWGGFGFWEDKPLDGSVPFIRADIAAEQVREAREAILTALADIPHPESTDAAEALERAYRAAEVAADMPEGSVRSIKVKVNEAAASPTTEPSPGQAVSSVAPAAWKSIETAPKDGTVVDLWGINHLSYDKHQSRRVNVKFGPVRDWMGRERNDWQHGCEEDFEPTHWMPIPPPPQENTDDQ